MLVGIENAQLVIQRQIDRGGADGVLVIRLYPYPAIVDLPENFRFRQNHFESSLEIISATPSIRSSSCELRLPD
jgi:hypothetical protein